jgi:hypothetical protein
MQSDAVAVSTDDLFDEAAARDGTTYSEAYSTYPYDDMVKSARARLIRGVIAGRDIIIDQTNCTVKDRSLYRSSIPSGYTTVGVQFEFDKDEIISRVIERGERTGKVIPIEAVLAKINDFEPCQPGEFDEVIIVPRGPVR